MDQAAGREGQGPDDTGLAPGLYEHLLTRGILRRLVEAERGRLRSERMALDPEEAPAVLARHLGRILERALRGAHDPAQRRDLVADVLGAIGRHDVGADTLDEETPERLDELLAAILPPVEDLAAPTGLPRPGIPVAQNALLVNARDEHRIGIEIPREVASADRVDVLCSFLKWSGFRVVSEALRGHLERRPGGLRVLTTCYLGATDRRVLDALVAMGGEVRVSYDTRRTRLHAKAWYFHRRSGLSTAYVGSSNLSSAALHDGLEWNVRVSPVESPGVLARVAQTFDAYWEDGEFEPYDPVRDAARFDEACRRERPFETPSPLAGLEVRPWTFQQEILDRLYAERKAHDRWRNLVVAATGTGKTIVAALDYARMRPELASGRLLFVAHREEILRQSRQRFREVLRDANFGELHVGGERPLEGRHVFASVQSLARVPLGRLAPDAYDMVIFDEIHHGEAPTYRRLLEHLRPKVLLGLTATPERADGASIGGWFGDRSAVELRLWEALDRGLLCPFQYFGIADPTDLSRARWSRRGYDLAELEGIYVADDARVLLVVKALRERVADPASMRAIGFCVGVEHARFMAARFERLGIPAVALTGETGSEERAAALRRLVSREVNVVFAVDLLNEGVDLPEVDTVLFLRPTESATVFLQQLGRGLRLAPGKEGLTVLDFVGKQAEGFRFDLRYRALLGGTKRDLVREVEEGFPRLPSGCSMQLERVAREVILENLRRALQVSASTLVAEVRRAAPGVRLQAFLAGAGLDPEDLYRSHRTWTGLRRDAGVRLPDPGPEETRLLRGLERLLHVDDPQALRLLRAGLAQARPPDPAAVGDAERRRWAMLGAALWGTGAVPGGLEGFLAALWACPAVRGELDELLEVRQERLTHVPPETMAAPDVPVRVHCRYSLLEILTGFGISRLEAPWRIQAGVHFDKAHGCDLLFVTLQKSEKEYSPSTMYRDYALSPSLFHWESQNATSAGSPTGRRYVGHRTQGTRVLLFVRAARLDGGGRSGAYTFLGDAQYVAHEGDRPMGITWRLQVPMPAEFFAATGVQAG